MSFKTWVTPYLHELFIPGTVPTHQSDITNVGMGIHSKYISDEEAGVGVPKSVDVADFGVDTQEEKEKTSELNKLKKLKAFRNLQRKNYVKS